MVIQKGSQAAWTLTWNMNTTWDWQILTKQDTGTLHVFIYITHENHMIEICVIRNRKYKNKNLTDLSLQLQIK